MRKAILVFLGVAILTVAGWTTPPLSSAAVRMPKFSTFATSQRTLYVAGYRKSAIDLYPAGVLHPSKIGSITQGINRPRDIFVDHVGTLYVANERPATVSIYPLGQLVPSRILALPATYPYASHITAGADGSIYVSMYNIAYDQWIVEYDPGASSPSRVISLKNSGQVYCCSKITGLALDSTNDLYVNSGSYGCAGCGFTISEYAPYSIQEISGFNLGPNYPGGSLEIDARDRIFVGDPADNAVLVAKLPNPGFRQYRSIATAAAGYSLTVDAAAHFLYATSGYVLIYDYYTGKSLGSTGIAASGAIAVYPTAF